MKFNRRLFIKTAAIAPALTLPFVSCSSNEASGIKSDGQGLADFSGLKNMTADVVPISREERLARIGKAQELMRQKKHRCTFFGARNKHEVFSRF